MHMVCPSKLYNMYMYRWWWWFRPARSSSNALVYMYTKTMLKEQQQSLASGTPDFCGPHHKNTRWSRNAFVILSPAIITKTVRLLSITAYQKRQQRQPTNMNDLLAASSRIGNRCIGPTMLLSHNELRDEVGIPTVDLPYNAT